MSGKELTQEYNDWSIIKQFAHGKMSSGEVDNRVVSQNRYSAAKNQVIRCLKIPICKSNKLTKNNTGTVNQKRFAVFSFFQNKNALQKSVHKYKADNPFDFTNTNVIKFLSKYSVCSLIPPTRF